jgi:hypothetical protein
MLSQTLGIKAAMSNYIGSSQLGFSSDATSPNLARPSTPEKPALHLDEQQVTQ